MTANEKWLLNEGDHYVKFDCILYSTTRNTLSTNSCSILVHVVYIASYIYIYIVSDT
jgi:hypothetical protein